MSPKGRFAPPLLQIQECLGTAPKSDDHRNASDSFLETRNWSVPKKRGHMNCLVNADYDESKDWTVSGLPLRPGPIR